MLGRSCAAGRKREECCQSTFRSATGSSLETVSSGPLAAAGTGSATARRTRLGIRCLGLREWHNWANVALLRKGDDTTTRPELRLRDLGKIWVNGFGPWEPAAASSTLR